MSNLLDGGHPECYKLQLGLVLVNRFTFDLVGQSKKIVTMESD